MVPWQHARTQCGSAYFQVGGAEKRTKGCGEEKTLYFGTTVQEGSVPALGGCRPAGGVCAGSGRV